MLYNIYAMSKDTPQKKTGTMPVRMPEDVLSKVKYIAWHDRETNTAVFIAACEALIKTWEKKNGGITDDMIKKAGI